MTGQSDLEPIATRTVDRLRVRLYGDRRSMGAAAAVDMATAMRAALGRQSGVRIVFAAAPSQNEFLDALAGAPGIDWSRVTAFHMDEYAGLSPDAPQAFGRYLTERLFDCIQPGVVHLIDGSNPAEHECARYAALLRAAPLDIVCLGIGENGHLAFNDPPFADFDDPATVRLVELHQASRRQQVNDGCFARLDDVPTHALTMTIPALLAATMLSCVVPGPAKRHAVTATVNGPITPACPASILRTHPDCTLYLDVESATGTSLVE
ncbi:MAG: glucosamine-6-phosphate deaminase [Thermomicrobiales bacterium]